MARGERRLRRAYGELTRIDFRTVVAPAIVALAERARLAREFFNIRDVEWTEKSLDDLERELRTYVLYDRDPAGAESALMGDSRNIGKVHTPAGRGEETPRISSSTVPAPAADTTANGGEGGSRSEAEKASAKAAPPALDGPADHPSSSAAEDLAPTTSTRRPRRHFNPNNPEGQS